MKDITQGTSVMVKYLRNILRILIEIMEERDISDLRYFLDFEFEIEVLDLDMKRDSNYTGCKIKLFPVIENGKLVICQCNDSDEVCTDIIEDIKKCLLRGLLLSMHLHRESKDKIYNNVDILKSHLYVKLPHSRSLKLKEIHNPRISDYVFKKYMPRILTTV